MPQPGEILAAQTRLSEALVWLERQSAIGSPDAATIIDLFSHMRLANTALLNACNQIASLPSYGGQIHHGKIVAILQPIRELLTGPMPAAQRPSKPFKEN
jgi:hypothetical protein